VERGLIVLYALMSLPKPLFYRVFYQAIRLQYILFKKLRQMYLDLYVLNQCLLLRNY